MRASDPSAAPVAARSADMPDDDPFRGGGRDGAHRRGRARAPDLRVPAHQCASVHSDHVPRVDAAAGVGRDERQPEQVRADAQMRRRARDSGYALDLIAVARLGDVAPGSNVCATLLTLF
jgi:hypothetical protein